MKKYILIGNGGWAKVVAELIHIQQGEIVETYNSHLDYHPHQHPEAEAVIAIGNNEIRKMVATLLQHPMATLVHPRAYVSPSATIHPGTIILANAVIQAEAVIGQGSIIHSLVTIDHEATIEDFVSIYPGSFIGSQARVTSIRSVFPQTVLLRQDVL